MGDVANRIVGAAAAVVVACTLGAASAAPAASGPYQVSGTVALGGEGRWDYVIYDPAAKLLYVPRSTHTTILSPATAGAAARIVGDVADTGGVHGVALAPEFGRAFTSNGKDATVTVIDLKNHLALGTVGAVADGDCIIYDPASRRVLVFSGDAKAVVPIAADVDPVHGKADPAVDLGGSPEYAVADGAGHVYVNIVDRAEIVALDTSGVKDGKPIVVTHHWTLGHGEHPTGLSMDRKTRRLFSGCRNKTLVVMDADSGKIVTTFPIGAGVDATAFDSGYVLASCGDGTLSVIHEDGPDAFKHVQTLTTQPGARTMAVDPNTHTIYLPTADMTPPAAPAAPAPGSSGGQPAGRPSPVAGTFRLVVVKRAEMADAK